MFNIYSFRGLLDDTYFIQAVKKVMQEPVPYFRQFCEPRATSPWSSTPRDAEDATYNTTALELTKSGNGSQIEEAEATPRSRPVTGREINFEIDGDETLILPDSERVSLWGRQAG